MNIKKNLGLALGIGLMSVAWVLACNLLAWPSWPGFIGWSIFFYSGADLAAMKKVTPCFIFGVLLAQATIWAQGLLPEGGLLYLPIFLLAFFMTYGQNIKALATVPATFLGSATHFAAGGQLAHSLGIGLVGILGLGLLTLPVVRLFQRLVPEDTKRTN